uniref:Wee1-like protein kinase n=1 Tax=Kalanchoe fedtschenkoi TaxID=63787 RepID=A0A7N0SZI2_KALFE
MKKRAGVGKRKVTRRVTAASKSMKGAATTAFAKQLSAQLDQISFVSNPASKPNGFRSLTEDGGGGALGYSGSSGAEVDLDLNGDEKDCILSQDFFCTPDYITPDAQNLTFDVNKENVVCPESPDKMNTVRSKRFKSDLNMHSPSSILGELSNIKELSNDGLDEDEIENGDTPASESIKKKHYVSQSAVALRCQALPPPCISNPYLKEASYNDPLGNQRAKCAGFFSSLIGSDGLSRYHTDFHEIEQIGTGNFSRVYKVLKRLDGCMYAVKLSTRTLRQDSERRKALMEVQALAALGSHENIVGYYSSWFENEHLYIQMEICDHSLSIIEPRLKMKEIEVLEILYQVTRALKFIHGRGIAHLDVKLDNIYVKNGVYKLGDFGCATLLDSSLPIEEGDARYMPQEILNDMYDHLDKVDIFSLGASMFELIRGSPLSVSGPTFCNLREAKLPLLPGHSMQLQNLLKLMVDPDPVRRPSADELLANPIFQKLEKDRKL